MTGVNMRNILCYIILVQSWTLGLTTTANTTGDTNGSTGFELILPQNSVYVNAVTNFASQGGSDGLGGAPSAGSFLITRTNANNDYSTPVTVFFTLGGTASNGVYTVLPAGITPAAVNSIVLPPGVVSTNITIIPTTNDVPRLTTTVVLTLQGGPTYSTALPVSDTVVIQNTSSNELVLSVGAATMYRAFSNDYASATITRLGDTNVTFTVPASAFAYAGTAVPNVDFTPVPPITFNPGDVTLAAQISPLANGVPPVDTINPTYVGNKSVTVTLGAVPGVGYLAASNSATLTLIDNAYVPDGVVLFSDPLTSSTDATNWNITYGTSDGAFAQNYNVAFGYDLTAANPNSANAGLIGLPPSGASNALRIDCNQNSNPGAEGGVNVYYTNQIFSGNYAVRFYMNVIEGYGTYQVGGPLFGINHNGMESNWWESSGPPATIPEGPWASDGIWYWMDCAPGGSASDYMEFTGLSALPNTGFIELATATYPTFATVFKDPNAFTTYIIGTNSNVSGVPANISPLDVTVPPAADLDWVDVEIRQDGGVVTMSLNKTPIFVYTNTTAFYQRLHYARLRLPVGGVYGQYINTSDQAAYFSGLTVVELGPYIETQPANITIGAGSNAVFAVTTAYGSSPVTNQLYTAAGVAVGSPVVVAAPGGLASLALNGVTPSTNGNYQIVVSDASGSVTSSVVSLTVISPPIITVEPVSVTNTQGATVTFTVTNQLAGTAPFVYQWYSNTVALVNGGQISGATTGTLTITNINASDAANYSVVVTNIAGKSTSTAAALTVVTPISPNITGVSLSAGNAIIQFTTSNSLDTASSFYLQSSTNLSNPEDAGFTNVSSATFTGTAGVFTVEAPTNSAEGSFYRLLHK